MTMLAGDMHFRLRGFYLVLLFGAITLPMLPVWQGGVRALAAAATLLAIGWAMKVRLTLGLLLVLSGLVSIGGWIVAFVQSPVSHTIHALTDVFGQPVGLLPDLALLGFDLLTVSVLGFVVWARHTNVWARVFTSCLAVFWLLSLFSVALLVANSAQADTAGQSVVALSGWATWIYWGFLGLLLFQSDQQAEAAIRTIALAALVVGGIVMLQWLAGDYSYYLGALDGNSSPFYRVRGTDYYHAPAALITALGALAFIGAMSGRIAFWPAASVCFLVGVTVLNNTRAISLSLIAGLLVLVGLNAARRSWRIVALALFATIIVMPNVLYLKPSAWVENAQPPAENAQPPAESASPPSSVENVAQANSPRSSLAIAGLALLPQNLILGTGPGVLDVPLEGNTFGGISSTYSTHVLYLDLLLMGGGLAFLFCMLALAASQIGGLRSALRQNPERLMTNQTLLAMLAAIAIASLFLPQERNELIGLAFACAGLLLCRQGRYLDHKTGRDDTSLPKGSLVIVSLAALGWAVVTSPAYVFPAIEFAARHGGEVVKNRQDVFVTDPALKQVLRSMLILRGGESAQVKLLPDGAQVLGHDNSWILWSPMRESDYPELIAELGHRAYPQHLYPLGIGTPGHWWVVPSAQPTVTFLFAGIRDAFGTGRRVSPNLAPLLDVRVSDNVGDVPVSGNVGDDARSVADRNNGTAVSWSAEENAIIEFGIPSSRNPGRLALYQLSALHRRSMSVSGLYSWRLEGANEHGEWRLIDQAADYPLSHDPAKPSLFWVSPDKYFDRYRLVFMAASNPAAASYAGLSEVQLHFDQPGGIAPIE